MAMMVQGSGTHDIMQLIAKLHIFTRHVNEAKTKTNATV